MITKYDIFDIETGPQAREVIDTFAPKYPEFVPPGEFDPSAVALGNVKDPQKIQEKIDAARAKHEASKLTAKDDYEIARKKHFDDFAEKAALSAFTGRILAIGIKPSKGKAYVIEADADDKSEAVLLREFWSLYRFHSMDRTSRMIGHCIEGFDVPFIIQRSWALRVPVPDGIYEQDRYLSRIFIDTMKRFTCGVYGARASLDNLAKFFGIPGKDLIDSSGAQFAADYLSGDPDRRQAAIMYLLHDLTMTEHAARMMGIIDGQLPIQEVA